MKNKSRQILVIFISVLFFLTGCGGNGTKTEQPKKEIVKAPSYKKIKVEPAKILDEINLMGIVEALRDVEISPEISGKIKKINFKAGDKVSKGAIIVELDDEEKTITLKKKKALLKKAEATTKKVDRDTKKADSLFKDGIISDSEYDDSSLNNTISTADLELARAEVLSAEKALRDTKLTAPFAGKIAVKEAEAGNIAVMGQKLLTLVDITQIKINVDVSEFDAAKIRSGNEAVVSIDSLPKKTFTGKVSTVGLKADESTRTYPVEIIVLNPDESILPGMVARASIKSAMSRKVIMVHDKAVETVGTRSSVQLVKGNTLVKQIIEVEKRHEDKVIVRSGLKPGDVIAINAR